MGIRLKKPLVYQHLKLNPNRQHLKLNPNRQHLKLNPNQHTMLPGKEVEHKIFTKSQMDVLLLRKWSNEVYTY